MLNSPINKASRDIVERKFWLISSTLPTGLTWLANALLSLRIRVELTALDKDSAWVQNDDNTWKLNTLHRNVTRSIPAIHGVDNLNFEPDLVVHTSHHWPCQSTRKLPAIIVIRDLRDALYSYFRRQSTIIEFEEFLTSVPLFRLSSHFAPNFLPPAETFSIYYLMWESMAEQVPSIFVRFEDMKQQPREVLSACLKFLAIDRENEAISRAIRSSDFNHAQTLERDVESKLPPTELAKLPPMHRRGMPGEWREVFTEKMHSFFTGLPESFLTRHGYETFSTTDSNHIATSSVWVDKAITCLEQSGVEATETMLESAILSSKAEFDECWSLALARLCGAWISDIYGDKRYDNHNAKTDLKRLLELSSSIALRPSIVARAIELISSRRQNKVAADKLAQLLLDSNELSISEIGFAASSFFRSGKFNLIRQMLAKLRHLNPTNKQLTIIQRALFRECSPKVALMLCLMSFPNFALAKAYCLEIARMVVYGFKTFHRGTTINYAREPTLSKSIRSRS